MRSVTLLHHSLPLWCPYLEGSHAWTKPWKPGAKINLSSLKTRCQLLCNSNREASQHSLSTPISSYVWCCLGPQVWLLSAEHMQIIWRWKSSLEKAIVLLVLFSIQVFQAAASLSMKSILADPSWIISHVTLSFNVHSVFSLAHRPGLIKQTRLSSVVVPWALGSQDSFQVISDHSISFWWVKEGSREGGREGRKDKGKQRKKEKKWVRRREA